jgi:hypothetical protein
MAVPANGLVDMIAISGVVTGATQVTCYWHAMGAPFAGNIAVQYLIGS